MPNIITHTLFAQEMMEQLALDVLERNSHLVEIGSNGPDFLFFHNFHPRRAMEKTPLRALGTTIHRENINAFYLKALEEIWNTKNPVIREQMAAYVCGHLMHWALDSTAHPYIFYKTGNCHGRSSWTHHEMESRIDSYLLKILRNKTIREADIAPKASSSSREQRRAVVRVYYPIIRDLYDESITPHMVDEALRDWGNYQKLIYDPSGFKRSLAHRIEKLTGTHLLLSGLIVPENQDDNVDLLNLLHKPWKNPATGEIFQSSFLELYESAKNRAEKAITLFLEAVNDPEKAKAFIDFIDNRSYNMGIGTTQPLQYFMPLDLKQ